MNKLIFISQSKGGSGVTTVSYLLPKMYLGAGRDDLGKEVEGIRRSLKEAKSAQCSTKEASQQNSLFYESAAFEQQVLLTYLKEKKAAGVETLFCDVGCAMSHELLYCLEELRQILPCFLQKESIKMEFYVVVCGGMMYAPTFLYLKNLLVAIDNLYPLTILKNAVYPFSEEQSGELQSFGKARGLPIIAFNFIPFKDNPFRSNSF
jgi:hypothetical protein